MLCNIDSEFLLVHRTWGVLVSLSLPFHIWGFTNAVPSAWNRFALSPSSNPSIFFIGWVPFSLQQSIWILYLQKKYYSPPPLQIQMFCILCTYFVLQLQQILYFCLVLIILEITTAEENLHKAKDIVYLVFFFFYFIPTI